MRFKLKRDLPFAGAGNPLSYSVNDNSYIMVENACSGGLTNIGHYQDLLDMGWIEEVKPREWWLEVTPEQVYVRVINLDMLGNPREKLFSSGSELVKVREVID